MSEKRFKLWKNRQDWGIIDSNETNVDYEDYVFEREEVVDLLNKQEDTIITLKRRLEKINNELEKANDEVQYWKNMHYFF